MIHFAVLILFQFNIFTFQNEFNQKIFDYHVEYNLRSIDDKNNCSIKTFLQEYAEVKQNNYPDIAWAYNFNCWGKFCTQPVLDFNNKYQLHCILKMKYVNDEEFKWWSSCYEETKELYKIHDLLDDCFHDGFNLLKKRKSLFQLRKKIGEQDFYAGLLPPPVPIWRFELFD